MVVLGSDPAVPLAGPANRQGRIAADNVMGRNMRFRGTQGTAIVGVFGCTAAMTGLSEKLLRRAGRPFRKVYVHPVHHAGYYPGAEAMTLKLVRGPWKVLVRPGARLPGAPLLHPRAGAVDRRGEPVTQEVQLRASLIWRDEVMGDVEEVACCSELLGEG